MNKRIANFSQKGFQKNFNALMKQQEKNELCCLDFLTGVSYINNPSDGLTITGSGTPDSPLQITVNGSGGGIPTPAAPSTSVELISSPGSANTYLRSDAVLALDQSITPTWTNNHTFKNGSGINAMIFDGIVNTIQFNNALGTTNYGLIASSATNTILGSQIATPLILRTNSADRLTISSTGDIVATGAITSAGLTSSNGLTVSSGNSIMNGKLTVSIANGGGSLSGIISQNGASGLGGASIAFDNSTAAADKKWWDVFALYDGSAMSLRAVSDDNQNNTAWLTAYRGTGYTIAGIASNSGTGTWVHTGNFNASGVLSSSSNGQIASVTNSGVTVNGGNNFAYVTLFDQLQSVNNRTAELIFISGQLQLRFLNDAHSTAVIPLSITGGQATGITGITSNSGSGIWTHTGQFTTTSPIVASSGYTIATLPAPSTALKGARAYVTNGSAPTFMAAVGTTGTVVAPVFCDGTQWVYA